MSTEDIQLVDAATIAKMLDITPTHVGYLYRGGRIPGIRISHRTLRYDPEAVLKAIGAIREEATDETK